ncbi:hypothetical protein T02_78 [Trichinella nativa]|uniref:Uncharacterized protein n=1 Tax=Trichinella nativa TaxID=6335 RepID=A0A0V1LP30_9BILA|nr:hypothetical protein T02_78 [Trichinella nativa]
MILSGLKRGSEWPSRKNISTRPSPAPMLALNTSADPLLRCKASLGCEMMKSSKNDINCRCRKYKEAGQEKRLGKKKKSGGHLQAKSGDRCLDCCCHREDEENEQQQQQQQQQQIVTEHPDVLHTYPEAWKEHGRGKRNNCWPKLTKHRRTGVNRIEHEGAQKRAHISTRYRLWSREVILQETWNVSSGNRRLYHCPRQ